MLTNNHVKTALDGTWSLSWTDHENYMKQRPDLSTPEAVAKYGYQTVNADVPGNFEQDLFKAGIIDDPYFGTNTLKVQELECMHMIYYRTFSFNGDVNNAYLHFDGIDAVADIFVNGKLIASTDNMFIPYEFKGANLVNGENTIVVHITPAAIAARKFDVPPTSHAMHFNFDSLYMRKAPHMYGWDIMPRILSGGIWRTVYIEQKPADFIKDVFFVSKRHDFEKNTAELSMAYNLNIEANYIKDYSISVRGVCGESSFSGNAGLWHTSGKVGMWVGDCKFWYPHNYGEPNLYETVVELKKNDEVIDVCSLKVGIRSVQLDRTSTTDSDGNGEFCIKINGKKIFAMGSNWVPVDAFHSNDVKRLPDIMPMLTDIGCNIVRCWGGNVYENEIFYDFCDENGIMIWQDFAMACATYPQEQKFLDMMEPEVISVIKKYRNHVSLTIWAGDNECDSCGSLPNPNDNVITRKLIPEMLRIYDFTRPYLPSSPYIDDEAFKSHKHPSEDHLWGPRDYFKGAYYKNTVCHFASETGYHGCPSPESLKKYISPDKLYPPQENKEWLVHAAAMTDSFSNPYAYRIPLMTNQVKTLFGEQPDNLEMYSKASQISQAEAKKYFIERFRISKWRRTGIIWWNLIDGWPQISDAVVDYYYDKKLAYYYIKRSQQTLCFMFDEPDNNNLLPLHVVNDYQTEKTVSYKVTDITAGIELISSEVTVPANTSVRVWSKNILPDEQHFYLIEWDCGKNHYMSGMPKIDLDTYIANARKCGFEV